MEDAKAISKDGGSKCIALVTTYIDSLLLLLLKANPYFYCGLTPDAALVSRP